MAKFKIQKAATVNQGFDAVGGIGGTGGLTTISGNQIRPNVFVTGSAGYGSILAQKGRGKFLVQDGSSNKGQCTLTNVPSANLAAGQMSIGVDTSVISYANVNSYVGSTTYAYITYLTANVSGVHVPAAGEYLRGTGLSGNVIVNTVTVNGLLSNANVTLSQTQVVANAYNKASIYVGTYAARLTNKFVQDFSNNEYTWTFSDPTSTTVRIPGA